MVRPIIQTPIIRPDATMMGMSVKPQCTCVCRRREPSPGVDGRKCLRLQFNSRQSSAVDTNESGVFMGVVSSWDVARECALDAQAWPYIRPDPSASPDDINSPANRSLFWQGTGSF
eukprot:4682100-Pyramimonas_sp.AAC.1